VENAAATAFTFWVLADKRLDGTIRSGKLGLAVLQSTQPHRLGELAVIGATEKKNDNQKNQANSFPRAFECRPGRRLVLFFTDWFGEFVESESAFHSSCFLKS